MQLKHIITFYHPVTVLESSSPPFSCVYFVGKIYEDLSKNSPINHKTLQNTISYGSLKNNPVS